MTPGETVGLILESDGPGGAENVLIQLATGLRDRGYEVCPIVNGLGCGWLGARFEELDFVPEPFRVRSALDLAGARGIAATLRRRSVSLLHCHEFNMSIFGGAAAWWRRLPFVITMHGNRSFAERLRRRVAFRSVIGRSRVTCAVSQSLATFMEENLHLAQGRVAVVPNGIEYHPGSPGRIRQELNLAGAEPLLLAVGNLYPVKGHIVLLRALAILQQRRPDLPWRLAIAGRGEEEATLREYARAQGFEPRLHILGYRSDVPDLLSAATALVMPSLSEALPLAVLEAMAAGVPVIASTVGDIPWVLEEGASGILVPPGEPEPLAEGLERLLTDPAQRDRIAARGRQRFESAFTLDRMVSAYEQIYRQAGIPAGSR